MKESFYISEDSPESGNQYPSETECTDFKEISSDYYNHMIKLSQHIFRLLALALDLPEQTFDSFSGADGNETGTRGSVLRLVHYPAIDKSVNGGDLGCGAHTDFATG